MPFFIRASLPIVNITPKGFKIMAIKPFFSDVSGFERLIHSIWVACPVIGASHVQSLWHIQLKSHVLKWDLYKTLWFWDVDNCDIATIGNWYGVSAGFFSQDDMVLTLIMQFISSILTSDLSQDIRSHMSSNLVICCIFGIILPNYIGIIIKPLKGSHHEPISVTGGFWSLPIVRVTSSTVPCINSHCSGSPLVLSSVAVVRLGVEKMDVFCWARSWILHTVVIS